MAKSKRAQLLEATPERVTIYASHPAFGLLHQMHQTERRLYKSDMENKALRESLDATAAACRRYKARLAKSKKKK